MTITRMKYWSYYMRKATKPNLAKRLEWIFHRTMWFVRMKHKPWWMENVCAVTTRVKKYRIFSRVLIYPISLPHLMLIHPFHLSSAFSKGPACSPPRVFLSFLKRISTYLQYTYKNECLICSQQQKFHSPCEDHLLRRLLNIKERKSVCRDIKRW